MIDKYNFFFHDSRLYITFSLNKFNNKDLISAEWLFFIHKTESLQSLFYGHGIFEKISKIRSDIRACIECNLSSEISGGISLDGNELVELHFSKKDANQIIAELQKIIQLLPEILGSPFGNQKWQF